jgi:hypothetical protein
MLPHVASDGAPTTSLSLRRDARMTHPPTWTGPRGGRGCIDYEIDLVALDEGFDLGYGDVGLELVVLNLELDVTPAELVAKLFERKLKPVGLLLTDDCRRPRQGCDQADLHLVGSLVLRVPDVCNETERRRRGDHSKQRGRVQLPRLSF